MANTVLITIVLKNCFINIQANWDLDFDKKAEMKLKK